jgi:hypothetical protein
MPTATIAAPDTSLVSHAYADLAAELRALAASIIAGPVHAPDPMPAAAVTVLLPDARAKATPPARRLRSSVLLALDLFATLVVLPVLAFNVAFRLFPPLR